MTRLRFLDVLRGFAVAGIVLVNVPDLTRIGEGASGPVRTALDLAVQTRFVPIFELLFGVGLWFVVRSARRRGRNPWAVAGRRLGALFGIGTLHALVYPGEILGTYAVAGLLVLPLVVLAPRWVQLAIGVASQAVVLALAGSSAVEAPGLMLIGAAAAGYGVPALLDRSARPVAVAFPVVAVLGAVALVEQLGVPGDPRFTVAGGRAGFVLALVYVAGLSLLWATPLRRVLAAVFEPLGRMALTCYVSASLVIVPVGTLLGPSPLGTALVLGVAVTAAQAVACRLWLRRFEQGPVEWVWRAVTWGRSSGAGLASGDLVVDDQDDHRADDRADPAGRFETAQAAGEQPEQQPAHDRAEDTEQDGADDADVVLAGDDRAGDEARDQAEDDPTENGPDHGALLAGSRNPVLRPYQLRN